MKMRPLSAVVIRLRWRNLPLAIPLLGLAVIFIPPAFLLIVLFEKMGWVAFVDVDDENW
jgi:hypothetical protein